MYNLYHNYVKTLKKTQGDTNYVKLLIELH